MKPYILILFLFLTIGINHSVAQEIVPIGPVGPVGPITEPVIPDGVIIKKNPIPTNPIDNTTNTEPEKSDAEKAQDESDAEDKRKEEDELKIKFDARQEELPQAKIWGQQFFRDQSISLFKSSRDIKAIDKYILGVGDELTVTVWGRTDYSANEPIDEEGFINLSNPSRGSHVPRLYLRGMKFSDAKKAIASRLANHMNIANSQIDIQVNYTRSLTINITGEVFHPGSYTMPAVNTAFNALVAAGGPSQIGSVRVIKVVSSEQEMRVLDVYEFMNNPKVIDEFFLHDNDYIYVPLAERVVEISGAIERPFFYELIENENLMELIRHSGGLRPDAYKRNIQIIRYENDEEKLIDVNLTKLYQEGGDFPLKDGDRISISPIEQAFANYVTVSGAVKIPGTYELEPKSKVYDVLKKSGIIRSAIMERIYLKRLREDLSVDYLPINVFEVLDNPSHPDNLDLHPFDELEVKYKAEFIDKYNVQIHGAVRKPGSFEYSDSLVLVDVIYMANGIKLEATNSIVEISRLELDAIGNETRVIFQKFNIDANLKISEEARKFRLEPYDQIFVRKSKDFETPKNVNITGEIRLPGLYTMADKNERVIDLLSRAGGITDAAFMKGAKLMRKGDGLVLLDLEQLMKEGKDSKYNYILKPGDNIIIPAHKNLVSLAGRINHPYIKENAEIEDMELDFELEKMATTIEKKELLLAREIQKRKNPSKVNIPYHEGKNALFYIKEYGAGIDRKLGGRNRLVYVRYANGAVKKARGFLFFKKYPIVEKGAMVYVDEKTIKPKKQKANPVDWYKVVRDTFAIVTSGLTLYALITALSK